MPRLLGASGLWGRGRPACCSSTLASPKRVAGAGVLGSPGGALPAFAVRAGASEDSSPGHTAVEKGDRTSIGPLSTLGLPMLAKVLSPFSTADTFSEQLGSASSRPRLL